MPPRKLTLKVPHEFHQLRLDEVLSRVMSDAQSPQAKLLSSWLKRPEPFQFSKAKLRKLIVAGAVYLNGKRVRIASKAILQGATIDLYIDLARLIDEKVSPATPFSMEERHIVFEDEWIIVINKPAGVPTQPTLDQARQNLFDELKRFLKAHRGSEYVGLHHRLDRDTSGVILFTKKKEANPGVADIFAKHLAQKKYQALVTVQRPLPARWTVKNFLGKKSRQGKQTLFGAVKSGGDHAHTDFEFVKKVGAHQALVWAWPLTGRTHQIRVHLSEGGTPIVGDKTYGGDCSKAERVMLHAASLTFPHPITKVSMTVDAPTPEDFLKMATG